MHEKIAELYRRYESLADIERRATDAINAAKESGKDSELPVPQADGSGDKMVNEKYLWREVYALGTECMAASVLRKKYPRVFELYAEQNRQADALRDFTMQAFGIDYQQLRMSDLVKLFEQLFEYRVGTPAAGRTIMGRLKWLLTGK